MTDEEPETPSFEPTYALTVPRAFYDSVASQCGQWWADAMLYDAHILDKCLTFRTSAGHDTAFGDMRFRKIADDLGLTLVRPSPFPGDGKRWTAQQAKDGLHPPIRERAAITNPAQLIERQRTMG